MAGGRCRAPPAGPEAAVPERASGAGLSRWGAGGGRLHRGFSQPGGEVTVPPIGIYDLQDTVLRAGFFIPTKKKKLKNQCFHRILKKKTIEKKQSIKSGNLFSIFS